MANLPADLPTDWTQGQIISPNGTEVGLSKQHGYNYLNEQVNDTQTEVNSLNTAQTNTKQQVNMLNTQVGNIQGQVNTQGQSITSLQGKVSSNDTDIADLQSLTTVQEKNITDLQSVTIAQGKSITTMQGEIGTLTQATTANGQNITSLQNDVSAINTSLESVAQETSVQKIITNIGSTADSGATSAKGSLMGKSNTILSAVNSLASTIGVKGVYNIAASFTDATSTQISFGRTFSTKTIFFIYQNTPKGINSTSAQYLVTHMAIAMPGMSANRYIDSFSYISSITTTGLTVTSGYTGSSAKTALTVVAIEFY